MYAIRIRQYLDSEIGYVDRGYYVSQEELNDIPAIETAYEIIESRHFRTSKHARRVIGVLTRRFAGRDLCYELVELTEGPRHG